MDLLFSRGPDEWVAEGGWLTRRAGRWRCPDPRSRPPRTRTTQPQASSMPSMSCTSPGEIKNRSPADTFLEWSSIRCCPRT